VVARLHVDVLEDPLHLVLVLAHRSTRELEDVIRRYIDLTNAHPTPFVWTKRLTRFSLASHDFVIESPTHDTCLYRDRRRSGDPGRRKA
jgi:hypothetical protein